MRTLGRAVKVQPKIKSFIIVGRRHRDKVKGGIFLGRFRHRPPLVVASWNRQSIKSKTTISLQSATGDPKLQTEAFSCPDSVGD